MTKTKNEDLVAEVLMDKARVKTVPLDSRSYEFINATLRRDSLMEDTAVGALLFSKVVPLSNGMQLYMSLFNGSYRGESRPHFELGINQHVSNKPDGDLDLPLDWKTIVNELPEEVIFKGSTLGISEDYHIQFKVVRE